MGTVQHGVIKPPNETHKGNRLNSSSPLGHGGGIGDVPNNRKAGATPGSSGPTSRTHPGQRCPNDSEFRFSVEDAQMGTTDPVATPGHGDIPVNPFGGAPLTATLRDNAKATGPR